MINRREILIDLVNRYKLQSYLELGLRDSSLTFDHIPCTFKFSVDVESRCKPSFCGSTDEFFKQSKEKFDLVLVDANHEAEFVYRDLMNSVRCLSDNGIVVLHDVLPIRFEDTSNNLDNGTAWKVVPHVLKYHPELHICTVPETKCGCGIVIKNFEGWRAMLDTSFNLFYDYHVMNQYRVKSQNLISYSRLSDWVQKPFYQF